MFFGFILLIGSGSALSNPVDGYFLMVYLMVPVICTPFTLTCRSTFYDGLLSRPVSEIRIAKNIVYIHHISALLYFGTLMALSVIIQRNMNDIFMIGSAFLYILGICNYIQAFAATFLQTAGRMELNVKFSRLGYGYPYLKAVVSKEAVGNRWIMPVFWLLTILSMVLIVSLYFFPQTHGIAFLTMVVLGLAGLLFHAGWVRLITRSLEKRRYELLERFRVSRRRVCSP